MSNDSISDISYTTAKAYATIIDPGEDIEQHGHCWSTDVEPTIVAKENMTENGPVIKTGSYTSTLTGLLPGTKYYVRAYAKNKELVIYGADILPFTTLAVSIPVVTTGTVTNITKSSAIVSASLNSLGAGASSVTQHGHCWSSETQTPIIENDQLSTLGSRDTTGSYESELVGLKDGTLYYVRAYATNSVGTAYGDTVSFTTGQTILSPTVTTVEISSVTETSAESGGNVTSDGGATVTARGVCWSTSESPVTSDDHTTDGSGTGSFTSELTGLSPKTTYYVRAYATNSAGTAYGNELEFITKTSILIDWQKSLGGSATDHAHSIRKTTDGGYVVAGESFSGDGDVPANQGESDYWIAKLTSLGNKGWQRTLGGSSSDRAYDIIQNTDGGYVIAGVSSSDDGDVNSNHGESDYWIVNLTSQGNNGWRNVLGGNYDDIASSIQQTSDGGYIVAGKSESNDDKVPGNHGGSDYWIVKLDAIGKLDWQKCLGGSSDDIASSIQQTSDGGYIVAGGSSSDNDDVSGNHGSHDCWIVKLTSTGEITWQESFGGSSIDAANSIQQTTDGGYIFAGYTESSDGDVTVNQGVSDYWIMKLTSSGSLSWQKSYGGSSFDKANSIQQTTDGGYIVAGESRSDDGDVSGNHGSSDYWIIKLNSAGEIEWEKSLGGSDADIATSIQQTTDGGYVIAGGSQSDNGDVTGNNGASDYWIVKIIED